MFDIHKKGTYTIHTWNNDNPIDNKCDFYLSFKNDVLELHKCGIIFTDVGHEMTKSDFDSLSRGPISAP